MSRAVPSVRKPGLFERLWRSGPPRPRAASQPEQPGLFRIVDWRLVAAVGLPLWAFLLGFIVARKPAPPAPEPVALATLTTPAPPAAEEPIPAPREVVIRTEV